MAIEPIANVVSLRSHPAAAAAQRRARQRSEAMRRHPSYVSRLGSAALVKDISAVVIELEDHRRDIVG